LLCPFSDDLFNKWRIGNAHNHNGANVISQFQEASVGLVLDLGCTIIHPFFPQRSSNNTIIFNR
jgi:hypothetical protein